MRRSARIGIALVLLVATCIGVGLILTQSAEAHGTCANHQYRTYDGTHDGDGDGVGCESKPAPPGRSGVTSVGYDRDNWSFNSSGARARLGCSSSEHVDHIVALKEAYDSGAAAWSSTRKAEFANDSTNLWCLEASVNLSKSDGDLAEWAGGSCAQRKAHRDRHAAGQARLRVVDRWRGTARDHRRVGRSVHPVDGFAVRHNAVLVKQPAGRRGVERRRRLVRGSGARGRRQQPSRARPTRVVLHPAAVARHRPRPAPHGLLPRRQLASARPQQLRPQSDNRDRVRVNVTTLPQASAGGGSKPSYTRSRRPIRMTLTSRGPVPGSKMMR